MNAMLLSRAGLGGGEFASLDHEMVEMALLLPSWQADELETAAHEQGLTAGELVRHLIRAFCRQQSACPSPRQSQDWHN
jgi:hypothetical protein